MSYYLRNMHSGSQGTTGKATVASKVKEDTGAQGRFNMRLVLISLLILGTFSMIIFNTTVLLGEVGLKIQLLKVMHVSHGHELSLRLQGSGEDASAHLTKYGLEQPPRSWFSLDSIMRPAPTSDGIYQTGLISSKTDDGEHYEGLTVWQKSSLCPEHSTTMDTWDMMFETAHGLTENQRHQIFCKKDEKHCPTENNDGKIVYPNPVMRDVCRLNRVSPMFVTENDTTSWSLLSSHSSFVLQFFIHVILFVTACSELSKLLYWNKYRHVFLAFKENTDNNVQSKDDCENLLKQWKSRIVQVMQFICIVFLVLSIAVRGGMIYLKNFKTGTMHGHEVSNDEYMTDVYARAAPNGSFVYGFFALFINYVWTIKTMNSLQTEMSDMHAKDMSHDNVTGAIVISMSHVSNLGDTPQTPSGGGSAGISGGGGSSAMTTLDVSGFTTKKKIPVNAYQIDKIEFTNKPHNVMSLPHVNGTKVHGDINRILRARCFCQSPFSILQFCVLPLWVLYAMTLAQGYEVDTDVQVVFIAAFVWAVSDIYLDRFLTITEAYHILDETALQRVDDYITLLVVGVQLVLVIAINFVTGWRYSERALRDDTNTMRTTEAYEHGRSLLLLNSSGIVFFNIYFGVTALLKIYKAVFKRVEHSTTAQSWTQKLSWFSVKTINEMLLGTLILFLFVYSLITSRSLDSTNNWFASLHTKIASDIALTEESREALTWAAGWVRT